MTMRRWAIAATIAVAGIAGSLLTLDLNGQGDVIRAERAVFTGSGNAVSSTDAGANIRAFRFDVFNPTGTDTARLTGTTGGMVLTQQGGTTRVEITSTGAAITGDLSTSSNFAVGGYIVSGGVITVALNPGANHDVNIGTAAYVRVNPQGATCTITGLTGGVGQRVVRLANIGGGSFALDAETGSIAANRIAASSVTFGQGAGVTLVYDATLTRWVIAS
jgi:hypothetical protein